MSEWDYDYSEPWEFRDDEDPMDGKTFRRKTCKFCGEKGLSWHWTTDGKWKLIKNQKIHVCKDKKSL